MHEIFKDKSPGDTLGAPHINKLNRVGRIVASQNHGAFMLGNESTTAGPVPFVQRLVIVSQDDTDTDGIYQCRLRYYDTNEMNEQNRWKTDSEAGEYYLDANSLGISLDIDDVLVAYWDPQRGAYIPMKSEIGSNEILGTVDNCECGGCVGSGAITDCAVIDEATNSYRLPMIEQKYIDEFGDFVILVWETGCVWKSDVFENINFGDGLKDYFWKLVFAGTGIEQVTLTLETL